MSATGHSRLMLSLVLGAVAGFVLGPLVALFVVRQRSQETVEAWRLVPVVVASVDVLPGAPLTMEDVSQRSIPIRFVSAAYVKPDSISAVVDGRVKTLLMAGAPLSRWMVAEPRDTQACGKMARSFAGDSTTPEVRRLIEAIERNDLGSGR